MPKNRTKRQSGTVLTVKHLEPPQYAAIHQLPRGVRNETMKAMLDMAAAFSKIVPNWHNLAIAKELHLARRRDNKSRG